MCDMDDNGGMVVFGRICLVYFSFNGRRCWTSLSWHSTLDPKPSTLHKFADMFPLLPRSCVHKVCGSEGCLQHRSERSPT